MKKFLALVLALVMTMSLVTISAGAEDFTDADKVTYSEAVDVMTAIGVVTGDTTGAFNPTNGLTRGAAAKIICNLILGPTTAGALNADAAPFSDVSVDNVFAGYIAYCAKEGIISGYADGTFKPANPLTGYAFMKMLLGAVGYDATKEGYVGSNWSINVAKQALALGLDDGLVDEFVGAKALTREEACLYALNTLTTYMVEYENDSTITVGDIVIQNNSDAKDVKDTNNDYASIAADQKVMFCEKYFANLRLGGDPDDFGRPANTWTWKNEEVGQYASGADFVWTTKVTQKDLYNAAGSNAVKNFDWTFCVDGNYSTITLADVASAGVYAYYNTTDDCGIALNKTNTDRFEMTGNGVTTEMYIDNLAKTVNVVIFNQYVGEISKIKTVADDDDIITVSVEGTTSKTYAIEDASDFAKEDIVVMTMSNGVVKSMDKAEVVEGKVSGYKTAEYAKLDGTAYNYNYVGNYNLDAAVDAVGNPTADSDATLYLDGNGYVVAYKATEAEMNYLYVVDATVSLGTVSAKVLFADGTTEVITVSKVDAEDAASVHATTPGTGVVVKDDPYTYTVTDGKYKLTTVVAGSGEGQYAQASGKTINRGEATFDGKVADKDTVFVDKKNATTYTGYAAVPSFSGVTYTVIFNDAGLADLVFITARTAGTNDAEGYFFVNDTTAYVYEKSGDVETWTYTVYGVDGEKMELVASDAAVKTAIDAAGVGVYEITGSDAAGNATVVGCILDLDITAVGTSASKYATKVGTGTITTNDTKVSNLWDTTTAHASFTGTYVYDDATDFITVALKSGNAAIDTVSAGDASDINVVGSPAEAEDTAVYVVTVDDSTEKTPLAELVVVVVPYV